MKTKIKKEQIKVDPVKRLSLVKFIIKLFADLSKILPLVKSRGWFDSVTT